MVATEDGRRPVLAPELPDHDYGLLKCTDFLAWRPDREAEARNGPVVSSAAQPENDPAAGEPVQRLGHLRHHARVAIGQAEHSR